MLYAGFADRYGETMTAEQRTVCERLVGAFDSYLEGEQAAGRPMGLVHGDYRLDNLLFGQPGSERALTIVEQQSEHTGVRLERGVVAACHRPGQPRGDVGVELHLALVETHRQPRLPAGRVTGRDLEYHRGRVAGGGAVIEHHPVALTHLAGAYPLGGEGADSTPAEHIGKPVCGQVVRGFDTHPINL